MLNDTLKLVFVPWGVSDYGADVWLLENALVFGIESILEKLSAQYADLYGQLQGDQSRTALVPPLTDAQSRELADNAPAGTDALIDGLISVQRDPETNALTEAEIAPRLFLLPAKRWAAPDAFVFTGFAKHRNGRESLEVADQQAFFALAFGVASALLAVLGVEIPRGLNAGDLEITESWPAYCDFLKAKRLARTSEEKLGYYRQAIRSDPRFYWALFNSAQILKSQEDYHGARRQFMECVKAANGDRALLGDTYFELGLCSIYLGDTKTARNFWDEAMRYAPENPSLLVNIGGTYEQEEDWDQAMALYAEAIEAQPDYHKAIVSLARLKAARGRMDEAIPVYERALALQPNDALRNAILGGCYLSIGNREKARAHFTRASELDPPRAARRSPSEEEQPSPGDYARDELAKLDEFDRRR
jgi:tetratricopeptide (TPR) repeat protein